MSIPLPDGRTVLRTVLIERRNASEHVLFERPGRFCSFAHDIEHDGHIVSLRIDWRDVIDGEPTLDAQIFEYRDGRRIRELPKRSWHHTRVTAPGTDTRCYQFTFRGLELELVAKKSFAVSTSLDAYIYDPGAPNSSSAA